MAVGRVLYRTRFLLLLVALALVASSSPAAAHGAGRTIEWGLTGCKAVIVLVPTSPASVQPYLPPGFSAVMPANVAALLPPDPRLEAVMGMEVLECEQGVGLHGELDGLDYASFWTFVEPPGLLGDRGHDLVFFKWDTLVPDTPRRKLLSRHGLTARDGASAVAVWSSVPLDGGLVFDAGWTFAGGEAYRFVGVAASPVDFRGRFIEYAQAWVGLAEWETRYRAPTAFGGAGTALLDPRGLPAQVLGRTLVDAYFLVGADVDFYDATITLPGGKKRSPRSHHRPTAEHGSLPTIR